MRKRCSYYELRKHKNFGREIFVNEFSKRESDEIVY